ncbi:MAG: GTPase HflX [Butyrivibrio sp.]|uniref:GTPase HflX n=1 Tax=Butyrivibrio sp. TaxID=28121 RepID=UPI001EB4BF73|nr:GTPase HflX [Butyrivibrio sp.]MBE5841573.1 GTPase HflX [Butyrivibrio sp.]
MKNTIYENVKETADPRAILVGLNVNRSESDFERSMDELKELTKAIDIDAVCTVTQALPSPDRSTYIGSGKVEEIRSSLDVFDANIIIFNDTLSPMQLRNLEKALDTEVIDRTGLILQIFARRAKTREARLQVEYAQLQYMLPRLAHMRKALSRQGGGSGRLSNKGSGEKQLELDRRRIEHRMAELRRELDDVEKERTTQRGKRINSGMPRISLVGYTNAGKSTIMNNLLRMYGGEAYDEKQVLEKDMLFATLDTSVRKIAAPGRRPFLLADTVGFISELPHSLVKAFRSTLDEAKYADILLEVVDFSDPEYRYHMDVTKETLTEIGAGDIPVLYVFNKSDIVQEQQKESSQLVMDVPRMMDDRIYISAKADDSLDTLIDLIEKKLSESEAEYELILPYSEGAILSSFNERGIVKSTEYLPEGIKIVATLSASDATKYQEFFSCNLG